MKKYYTKRLIAFFLIFSMTFGISILSIPIQAKENHVVPEYMKELSELVRLTWDDMSFGSIKLEVGSAEMTVDGEVSEISSDESVVPSINSEGEIEIPAEIFENIDEDIVGSSMITEKELENNGYEVAYDKETNEIFITEPFGLKRLIVKTVDGNVSDTFGATHEIKVSNNKTVLQYGSKEAAEYASEQFSKDPDVLFCAEDSVMSTSETECEVCASETTETEESEYKGWGTTRVAADQYMKSMPDASELNEVVVAVVDSGVDLDHPFLENRIKDGGWDFVNNDSVPDDDESHGTHCAGIVVDATKENVKILPIKVMDETGRGPASLTIEGVMYAAENGADIISMSLGGNGNLEEQALWEDTIGYAKSKNIPCVVAAGNVNDFLPRNLEKPLVKNTQNLPAEVKDAITVSASHEGDFIAHYSCYGEAVDICAPGSHILSSVPGGEFEEKSGTSMSTPLVAAAVALYKSTEPNLTVDEICEKLSKDVQDRGDPGKDTRYGYGVLWLGGDEYIPLEKIEIYALSEKRDGISIYRKAGDSLSVKIGDYVSFKYFMITPKNATEACFEIVTEGDDVRFAGSALASEGRIEGRYMDVGEVKHTIRSLDGSVSDSVTVNISEHEPFIYTDGYYYIQQNNDVLKWKSYWLDPAETSDGVITDVKKAYRAINGTSLFLKNDGTVFSKKTFATDKNGEKISGVADINEGVILKEDGTVWIPTERKGLTYGMTYAQLMKEDGTPLTNVKSINAFIAVTNDGYAYFWCDIETQYYMPAAILLCNGDGTAVSDIAEAYCCPGYHANDPGNFFVVRKTDGTVWAKGYDGVTNPVESYEFFNRFGNPEITGYVNDFVQLKVSADEYLTDVKQIYFDGESVSFALKNDGTVWSWGGVYTKDISGFLCIGPYNNEKIYISQVKVDSLTYLTGVRELIKDFNYTFKCIKNDGQIYWGGCILGVKDWFAAYPEINDNIFYAEPMYYGGQDYFSIVVSSQTKVIQTPDKTEYFVGETLDTTGMSLEITYSNGETKTVSEGFICTPTVLESYGTQTIIVEYDGLTTAFNVAVNKKDTTVTGIELPDKLTLNFNESFNLTGTIIPHNATNKNIIWSTSDKNVATVDENGKVTAVGKGTAVITATTEDGGFTAECEVTVKYSWWQWIMYILLFGFIWM